MFEYLKNFNVKLYHDMNRDYSGICFECGEVQEMVEPDAEGYECHCCGEHAVAGAMIYLFTVGEAA